MHRRTLLRAALPAGTAAVAGCPSGGSDGGDYGDWFADVDGFDGTVDRTGRETVRVRVGAGDDGLAFAPMAVRVDVGTEVVWEWTGRGGRHNVASERGLFRSQFAASEGHTYSHRFEDAGTYLYYCRPHRSLGMKGAVRVVE